MSDNTINTGMQNLEMLNRLCGKQLSIKFEKDENQYFCFCRGVHPEKYLLTQTPAAVGIEKKMMAGKQAVVRFVESGMVCGFKTRVQQAILKPYRLIFLDYPDSIEMVNLRTSKRVAVSIKAVVNWEKERLDGQIRDLSGGGCFFTMKYWQDPLLKDLNLDSTLSIRFSIPGDESVIELKCRPVRIIREEEDLKMGLSFDDGQQGPTDRVASFVEYIAQLLES